MTRGRQCQGLALPAAPTPAQQPSPLPPPPLPGSSRLPGLQTVGHPLLLQFRSV